MGVLFRMRLDAEKWREPVLIKHRKGKVNR